MPIGSYIPKVMTFGLKNAPSVFQRAMNRDLRKVKQKYPDYFANFMDDVCIATDNSPEGYTLHQKIVHEFLDTLEKHSYFLKVSKCQFKSPEIEFLGYVVKDGIARIDPTKISGLKTWPRELQCKGGQTSTWSTGLSKTFHPRLRHSSTTSHCTD
jgi:hypothetical protein